MGRLRRVIPYLLFPSDPASAAMHCAPAGHAPRSVSAPMKSRAPAAAEAPRRVRSRGSHIDLADGLETGSPYFHLYSPGLALSRGGSLSCSYSPLSESALICSSFSPEKIYLFCSERLARCRCRALRAGPSGEERCTPHYTVPVSPQCPQEISLLTLPVF